jgi:hypothetical protein
MHFLLFVPLDQDAVHNNVAVVADSQVLYFAVHWVFLRVPVAAQADVQYVIEWVVRHVQVFAYQVAGKDVRVVATT